MTGAERSEEITGSSETLERPGTMLARAREREGLTRQQIAVALHLSVDTVAALEDDDYTELGAPVFIRGHLRRYADQLRIDPEPVLEAYGRVADLTEPRLIVPERAGETVRSPVGRQVGILLVVVVALASAAVWLYTVYLPGLEDGSAAATTAPATVPVTAPAVTRPEPQTADEAEDADAQLPAEGDALDQPVPPYEETVADQVPADEQPDPVQLEGTDGTVADEAVAEQAQDVSAEDVAPLVSDLPQVALQVDFIRDAWLEVTDANGEQLHYDLGREGERLMLTGAAPLRVFLGDGTAVAMRSDGFVIDPSPFLRGDNTARFAVDANGMIRNR